MPLKSWMRAYFSEHLTLISRGILSSSLAGNYMFKVNYKNNRASCEICSYVVGVALSLFLTLNTFHTLFWSFYCELWEGKCRLGDWLYCRCLLRTLPNIYDGAFLCKYFHFLESFHHQYHACKITLQYILIKVTPIAKLQFFWYLVHILSDFFCRIYANLRSIFKFYCINVLLGIFWTTFYP